ncbi:MAG: diacylglycerol kinase family lipid kinase [Calditrichia bacterium]
MKIIFIVNSQVRKRKKIIDQIVDSFQNDHQIEIWQTEFFQHAIQFGERAIETNPDIIVAVGGDGHINEVINGLFAKQLRIIKGNPLLYENLKLAPLSKVKFAFLPTGTGNDYARSFRIGPGIKKIKNRIENLHVKHIDLGLIRFIDFDGNIEFRIFNNITDIGIGAYVLQRIKSMPPWLNANIAYFYGILSTLFTFRYKRIHIETDVFNWNDEAISVAIAKGTFFGSGIGIAPQAQLTDNAFAVTIIGKVGPKEFLKYFSSLKRGEQIIDPEIIYEKASMIKITSEEDKNLPVQMDGELIGTTPVEFKILPNVLQIITEGENNGPETQW